MTDWLWKTQWKTRVLEQRVVHFDDLLLAAGIRFKFVARYAQGMDSLGRFHSEQSPRRQYSDLQGNMAQLMQWR